VVTLSGSMISAVGSMGMEVEADISKAFVLHALIDHASVIAWGWRVEWNFPEACGRVPDASKNKAILRGNADFFSGEGGCTAIVAELSDG
jgi:hypothetical protein